MVSWAAEPAASSDEGLHEERGDAGVFAGYGAGGLALKVLRQFMLRISELRRKAHKPLLEGGGSQHTREPGKCIAAGDAVFQWRERLPEFPFGISEKFHMSTGPAAAGHSAENDGRM